MNKNSSSKNLLVLVYLGVGCLVWVIPAVLLIYNYHLIYQVVISIVLLFISLYFQKKDHLKSYYPTFFSFFLASLVYIVAINFGGGNTIENKVINNIISGFFIILPIIILYRFSGGNLQDLYLQKGNLRLGLIIGIGTLIFFLITAIPVSSLFGAEFYTPDQLLNWKPWILIFILVNATREELWFRGLFLKHFESQFGEDTSNILQATIFSLAHISIPFSEFSIIMLIVTFLLGLGFGATIKKTDSLLGGILFHAGADIPVIIAAFSLVV